MQLKTIWDALTVGLLHPSVFCHEVTYLFLVSHIRSRSTLLSHILGSHPAIAGYREWVSPYTSKTDFMRLRLRSWQELKWDRPAYLQDKVLHPQFTPTIDCLKKQPTKVIFFVRDPEETIRSCMALGEFDPHHEYTAEWATPYYCKRLRAIKEMAAQLPKEDWIFFESTEIIASPAELLQKIQNFLGLKEPLRSEYKQFKGTGQVYLGDPSEHIKAGKILTLDQHRHDAFKIPTHLLEKARAVFEDVTETITALQEGTGNDS